MRESVNEKKIHSKSKIVMSEICCYLLHSEQTHRTYVGITADITRRIRQHNGLVAGGAKYTRMGRPWHVHATVHGFPNRRAALQFEWAWKHGTRSASGRTPLHRRLVALEILLRREKWTANAPAASSIKLTVSKADPDAD